MHIHIYVLYYVLLIFVLLMFCTSGWITLIVGKFNAYLRTYIHTYVHLYTLYKLCEVYLLVLQKLRQQRAEICVHLATITEPKLGIKFSYTYVRMIFCQNIIFSAFSYKNLIHCSLNFLALDI